MKQDESKQAAHTPGAWIASEVMFDSETWNSFNDGKYPATCVKRGANVIAIVWGTADNNEDDLAQAKFIAAAPETARKLADLRYAARDALSMLDQFCDCGGDDWDQGVFDRLHNELSKWTDEATQ